MRRPTRNVEPNGTLKGAAIAAEGGGRRFSFLANATDETRAGERGVSPSELRKMLSGEGAYDSGHIPRVVLWRSGWALGSFLFGVSDRIRLRGITAKDNQS